MSGFDPVAIVGRSCILPGATTPEGLFEATLAGRCLLTPTRPEHWRGVDPAALLASDQPGLRVASATGGYIGAQFDLGQIASQITDFERLDPIVHWLAYCAQQAVGGPIAAPRTGLIVGNLSYPSSGHTEFVEAFWTGGAQADPRNRFSSGLPVPLVAGEIGRAHV